MSEWSVTAEPDLQIGVIEGDPNYELHRVLSAVTLPDGRIAALNAGSHELRIYDSAGRLLSRTGGRGDGPGEFQNPLRVHLLGDTLVVVDTRASRLSLHDREGKFIATRPLQPGTMQWDQWLYDMSWIDGPPLGRGRTMVKRALARLPPPDSAVGYRYVRVDQFGHLWVRKPVNPTATTVAWDVHDVTGGQIARVELPANLEVYDVGPDYLIGRVRDSLGVEYLRRHRLERPAARLTRHAFGEDSAIDRTTLDRDMQDLLGAALRSLAAKQEEYYSAPSSNFSYADDHRKLPGYTMPQDVVVRIVDGHITGWTGIAMHALSKRMCGISFGTTPPAGWTPGVPQCF